MTIGTAVPTTADWPLLRIILFKINQSENYTVGEFEKKPLKKDDLFLTDDYVILVGGSGLYVNAILKGFDDFLK
jgi:tRNA dimethylallyltransferase